MLPQTSTPEKRHLTGKYPELMAGLLGIAALIAINLLWFRNDVGFFGVHPHPYWIVILLIATRYGFRGGLWSGFLCAITFVALFKFTRPGLDYRELMAIEPLTTPALFLVMGLIVGQIREVQKRQFNEREKELGEVKAAFDQLSDSYEVLNKMKQELDTRIISQEHTLSTLYEAAQALKSLQERDIYPAILELVHDFISAEAASIYMLSENRLQFVASSGDRQDITYPRDIDPSKGMAGRALAASKTITMNVLVTSEDFESNSDFKTIISSPLIGSKNQVLGVLNIHKLPFDKFNPQAVRVTTLLADWSAAAIENARTFQETKDKNISDDITGAYTFNYLQERLEEEYNRARRYRFPLSILVIDIKDFHTFSDEVKEDILTVFSLIILNKTRGVDLLFHSDAPGRYVMLLPNTPLAGARVVQENIVKEVGAFKFKPYEDKEKSLCLRIGIAGMTDETKDPDQIISNAIEEINALVKEA